MNEKWEEKKDHSIMIAALIFFLLAITFGTIISMQIYLGIFTLPFYLMVVGMFLFATSLEIEDGIGEWIASFSWMLNMIGIVLFYQLVTGFWNSWAYAWPLVFPMGPGLGQLIYGIVKVRRDSFEKGKILVRFGFGLFVLIFIIFQALFSMIQSEFS